MMGKPARIGAVLCCMAGQALAHPHEFYDAGADFLFDAQSNLAAVRIVWIYDEFTSLYVLSEQGLDPTQSPQGDELDRLLLSQLGWTAETWDGDAYLHNAAGEVVALGDPRNALATVHEGRLVVVFERPLVETLDLSSGPAELLIYDPGFYSAYTIIKTPRIEGRTDCTAEIVPFRMTPEAAEKLSDLMALTVDETPEEENVGAEFADRIVLKCD